MKPTPVIQGPHCIVDLETPRAVDGSHAVELVADLTRSLEMKPLGKTRMVGPRDQALTVYQIVSTSHIIMHVQRTMVRADLFSCESFDVDRCVSELVQGLEGDLASARVQYCQRNLLTAPAGSPVIPMASLNALTSNPATLTHAMVNCYSGDEALLGDARHAEGVLARCLQHLDTGGLDPAGLSVLPVAPVESSWDLGGVSGGYIDLLRQLTIHSFAGLNGAYTDILAHTFDLEAIIRLVRDGFGFSYYEVDAVFQREL